MSEFSPRGFHGLQKKADLLHSSLLRDQREFVSPLEAHSRQALSAEKVQDYKIYNNKYGTLLFDLVLCVTDMSIHWTFLEIQSKYLFLCPNGGSFAHVQT